ncbi:MAG: alpha/beta fold hydrolase [Chloroflexota bacterium]
MGFRRLSRRFWSISVILLVVGLMLSGLHPPAAASQDAAVTASPVATSLSWELCADVADTECAWLEVRVVPARPDGPQLTLRLARVPAIDPARRRGALLLIPGGPGAGIREMIASEGGMREEQHVDEFRQHYDVVTFDPRGIGQSNPIRCDPDLLPEVIPPRDHAPSAAEFAALAEANAAFYESCFAATGELMAHLSVNDTAADIERIRQALGEEEGLIAYGGSYGAAYGAAYLERYGEHVKAMVLDGVFDHTVDMPTLITRNILAAQDAFDRFARWCTEEAACALHGEDIGSVFDEVIAIAPVTRTLLPQMLAGGADPNAGWPVLAQMLADVRSGDTATLEALRGVAALESTASDPWVVAGKNGLFPGVLCATFGPQNDYEAIRVAGEAVAQQAPRFAWKFWDANPLAHGTAGVGDCAGWPLAATNPAHRLDVGAHPNVLVANPTHDPSTPLANALSIWLQIPQARLLIADVDGHQSLLLSDCAYQAMARFLDDPSSLASTTVCPN